jgi:hypothetical protein
VLVVELGKLKRMIIIEALKNKSSGLDAVEPGYNLSLKLVEKAMGS